MNLKIEYKDQNDQCDFCENRAILKVKLNDNDWSISCKLHEKDAIESITIR